MREPGSGADWERLELLYERALALPAEERGAFLAHECADLRLRSELEALLDRSESATRLFDVMATSLAALPGPAREAECREGSAYVPSSTPGRASDADPLLGRTVEHYRIERRIGGGSMGVVYRARDLRLHRRVALKFLPPHLGLDPPAKQRLLVEARAAAALDHPNICTIHEIGETADGRLFLAMACYEGETLKARIARDPLPVTEAVSIAAALARGLSAAHAAGIIHRDVKPANVMLTARGEVRLLDFGVAKVADASARSPGLNPGTVSYMSPEQIRGEVVDAHTDMWSLGVVLYEMITGVRPFRGDSDATVMRGVLGAEPRPPAALRDAVPAATNRLVLSLLSRDPRERLAGFDRLLVEPAGGAAPTASADGVLPPREHPRRGRPLGTTLVAGVLLLIGTGAWSLLGGWGPEATTVDRADLRSNPALPLEAPGDGDERAAVRIRARPPPDLDAYEAYLRGVEILNRYEFGDPAEAIEHLEKAIELDPEFAEAHGWLAQGYFDLGFKGRMPREESVALAEASARRALELDEALGEAHAVLALVAEERSDPDGAEREYRLALQLSPGFAMAHEAYAELLLHLGKADEALSQTLLARELDPQSSRVAWSLGEALYLSREHGRAIEHLRRWTQDLATPTLPIQGMLWVLASAQTAQGRHDEAIETDNLRSAQLGDGAPACLDVCAIAHARAGRPDEARAALERILAWREVRGLTGMSDAPRAARLARIYAALGDADHAIEWLERDLRRHKLRFTYAKLDPLLDPVRGDPRFQRILERIP